MKLNLLSLIAIRNKRGNFIKIIESYSSSFEVSYEIMEKVKPRRFCSRRTATVMGSPLRKKVRERKRRKCWKFNKQNCTFTVTVIFTNFRSPTPAKPCCRISVRYLTCVNAVHLWQNSIKQQWGTDYKKRSFRGCLVSNWVKTAACLTVNKVLIVQ